MDPPEVKEVFTLDKEVLPGYVYEATTAKFSRDEITELVSCEDQPIRYSIDIWNKKYLERSTTKSIFREDAWVKDFVQGNAVDAIMVRGIKILEKTGIGMPEDHMKCRVTSTCYKAFVDMLILFSHSITKETQERIRDYFANVLNSSSESFIPKIVEKIFVCSYIYKSFNAKGVELSPVKYCFEEYCSYLKQKGISSNPTTAFLKVPTQSRDVNSGKTVDRLINLFENKEVCKNTDVSTLETKGKSHHVEAESNLVCLGTNDAVNSSRDNCDDNLPMVQSSNINITSGHKENALSNDIGRDHGLKDSSKGSVSATQISGTGRGQELAKSDGIGRERGTMTGRGNNECPENASHGSVGVVCNSACASTQQKKDQASQNCLQRGEISGSSHSTIEVQTERNIEASKENSKGMDSSKGAFTTTYQDAYSRHNSDPSNNAPGKPIVNVEDIPMNGNTRPSENSNKRERDDPQKGSSESAVRQQSLSKVVSKSQPDDYLKEEAEKVNASINLTNKGERDNYRESCSDKHPLKEEVLDSKGVSSEVFLKDCTNNPGKEEKCVLKGKKKDGQYHSPENVSTSSQADATESSHAKDKSQSFSSNDFANEPKKKKKNSNNNKVSQSMKHQEDDTRTKMSKQQKQLCQAFGDDTDEPLDLKATKKQKCEQKQKTRKSKLLKPVKRVADSCGIERKYYGCAEGEHMEKVMLLLGASGSGKTMLVNFIANYFMNNKTADDELIHVEDSGPTDAITAYTFCNSSEDIPITVIDTPGLNDSSGAEVRDHVQTLKTFIANASSKGFDIHAIGFVAQAYLVRLTSSERLVMDYVSTLFGQSISQHLISLVTFADNQDSPPVVEAMKNYGVNFKTFLKFNNSALNNTKSDEIDDLDRAYWRICWRNWKKCLKTIKDLSALSVNTMKVVQSEVFASTVIDSAERDLIAELKSFFTICKNNSFTSKEAIEVCENIWELSAVVQRLKNTQCREKYGVENVLVEFALEACKQHNISPKAYIGYLSLCPSRPLITSGAEVIRTMVPFFRFVQNDSLASASISKNIAEWSYCNKCKKEHKMKRIQTTGKGVLSWVYCEVTMKCVECKCAGDLHRDSTVKSPFHISKILQHTQSCLNKVRTQYSLPEFPVEKDLHLKFLNLYFHSEHLSFFEALVKMGK